MKPGRRHRDAENTGGAVRCAENFSPKSPLDAPDGGLRSGHLRHAPGLSQTLSRSSVRRMFKSPLAGVGTSEAVTGLGVRARAKLTVAGRYRVACTRSRAGESLLTSAALRPASDARVNAATPAQTRVVAVRVRVGPADIDFAVRWGPPVPERVHGVAQVAALFGVLFQHGVRGTDRKRTLGAADAEAVTGRVHEARLATALSGCTPPGAIQVAAWRCVTRLRGERRAARRTTALSCWDFKKVRPI
ncbi:hypothetical protein ISCGN_000426 [Ixodes scapularis]